jgi:hypothetical protein
MSFPHFEKKSFIPFHTFSKVCLIFSKVFKKIVFYSAPKFQWLSP